MRVAVFGAGAMGSFFAARLSRAGHAVSVIARGTHLDAIGKHGIRVDTADASFTSMPTQVTDDAAAIGNVDAVILAVKAWQVPEAASALAPLIGATTKVLTVQNGIEAADQVAARLGSTHVLVGVCRVIVRLVAPGHVHQAGLEPAIMLGEHDASAASTVTLALTHTMRGAGFSVELTPDSQVALWGKLVLIAALSGIGAVARATAAEIRACAPTRRLLREATAEVADVATASGVRLREDVVERTLSFVDGMPEDATTSMHRDIAAGKPSELDAIIGAVVRSADKSGVDVPVLQYVYATLLPQELRARLSRK